MQRTARRRGLLHNRLIRVVSTHRIVYVLLETALVFLSLDSGLL